MSTTTATEPAPPAPPKQPARPLLTNAGIALGVVAFANALFYFLSDKYFAERVAKHGPDELAGIDGARASFLVFSLVVGAAATAGTTMPRAVGHALGAAAGLACVAAAFAVFSSDLSVVLGATLLALGVIFPIAAHRSWHGSRAAWAMIVSLAGTLGLITMFAAPTLGRMFGISMWQAMILPGLLAVAAMALFLIQDRYREH